MRCGDGYQVIEQATIGLTGTFQENRKSVLFEWHQQHEVVHLQGPTSPSCVSLSVSYKNDNFYVCH